MKSSAFGVWGLGFRDWGLRVEGEKFRVFLFLDGSGFLMKMVSDENGF